MVQIPKHLECPEEQLPSRFSCYSARHNRFYRCSRTWLAQAGILDKKYIESGGRGQPKHVKKVTSFLNRILGMNFQQQHLIFEYAADASAFATTPSCNPRLRPVSHASLDVH